MAPSPKSTAWVFTINNPTDEDRASIKELEPLCKYIVYGNEVGEKEGTPHLQGYLICLKESRRAALSKILKRAYLEVARGKHSEASDYCKKGGDYLEFGTLPSDNRGAAGGAKRKQAWEDARQAAKEGRFEDIPADMYTKYQASYDLMYRKHMTPPPDCDEMTGVWLYGPPGVGKSRKAREDYPGAYLKMQNKWWDGFQPAIHKYVILDDFDSKELGHHLKIWADRYAFLAEVKGSAIVIRPEKFVVISNYHPSHFDWDPEMKEAVIRRFKIIHMVSHLGGIDMRQNPTTV